MDNQKHPLIKYVRLLVHSSEGKATWVKNIPMTRISANRDIREGLFWEQSGGPWLCLSNVWDCSIGVSITPPVTLRFPPMQRHVTSLLCFPAQEDLSKNVFLFKGSQQPFFLLCLPAHCVCVGSLVIIYIVGAHKQELLRCRWGCWRVCVSSLVHTYIQPRILFHNTLWMWWG